MGPTLAKNITTNQKIGKWAMGTFDLKNCNRGKRRTIKGGSIFFHSCAGLYFPAPFRIFLQSTTAGQKRAQKRNPAYRVIKTSKYSAILALANEYI